MHLPAVCGENTKFLPAEQKNLLSTEPVSFNKRAFSLANNS